LTAGCRLLCLRCTWLPGLQSCGSRTAVREKESATVLDMPFDRSIAEDMWRAGVPLWDPALATFVWDRRTHGELRL